MSVKLNSISIATADFPYAASSNLRGAVNTKKIATINFEVSWSAESIPGTFTAATKKIKRTDGLSFKNDGFLVGDTIVIANTAANNGTKTIAAVSDNGDTLTTVEALVDATESSFDVFGETPITAIDFYPALIENAAPISFKDLTDIEFTPRFNTPDANAAGMALTTMSPVGSSKGWLSATATLDNVSFTDHKQKFTLVHTFEIIPSWLEEWFDAISNGDIPVGNYDGRFNLKYIYKIDAKFDNINPDVPHTSDFVFPNGSTALYDEALGGFDATYTLVSITYKDSVSLDVLDSLQATAGKKTNVEIKIFSVNSKFFDATQVVLEQFYAPLDPTDYQNTPTEYKDNFRKDRVVINCIPGGDAPVDGEESGTDNQSIKSAVGEVIDGQNITITYECDLATAISTFLLTKDSSNRNYLISCGTCDVLAVTEADNDEETILIDFNSFSIDQDDATLFSVINDNYLYKEPNEVVNEMTDGKFFVRDSILDRFQFKIDTSLATIEDLTFQIQAEKSGETSVVLEEKRFDLTRFLPDCQTPPVQHIDISESRGYRLNADDRRSLIEMYRMPALDSGNFRAYELDFGFYVRWENWIENPNHGECFPNGSMDWSEYSGNGWDVKINIIANMKNISDGYITNFTHSKDITILSDEDESDTPMTSTIETFDETGTNNAEGDIYADRNTLVRIAWLGDFSKFPSYCVGGANNGLPCEIAGDCPAGVCSIIADSYYAFIDLDNSLIGGTRFNDRVSNLKLNDDTTWTAKATVTKVDNGTIVVEAILDYTKLRTDLALENYQLSGRLDFYLDVPLLLDEDGSPILNENGAGIILNT